MKCSSGLHEWIDPDDAEKCCNGFQRVLVIGNTTGCTNHGNDPLPGGQHYGYRWEKNKTIRAVIS